MSCEGQDLNNKDEKWFGSSYLFHSHQARREGVVGESVEDLDNPHVKRMGVLGQVYQDKFGAPITLFVLRAIAAGVAIDKQSSEGLIRRTLRRFL